ncbi:hypothetical protein KR067_000340, partial [Drosophila pandora]
ATNSTSNRPEDGPFNWNSMMQANLLTCYFLGYLVQIPLARIAEKFSAKWLMFFSVAFNVVPCLLTPVLAKLHYGCLILMRVLQGIGGGASFPAMHVMIASWTPPTERTAMSTIIYVGTYVGSALSIIMDTFLAEQWGWESVFYVMGTPSYIWMGFWLILIQDNPNKQRFISPEERQMINKSLGTEANEEPNRAVPWKKIFKSSPFWAILIAHTCTNFGWTMFFDIPWFIKSILDRRFEEDNFKMCYLNLIIFLVFLGMLLHYLQTNGKISATCARKIATSICALIPAACLIILCFIKSNQNKVVALMTVGIVAMGAKIPGFMSNHIDIAPNFAGTLVALTNTVATLPGIVVPIFVGVITSYSTNIGSWVIVFGVTILLFAIEFLVFIIFGSAREQSWN